MHAFSGLFVVKLHFLKFLFYTFLKSSALICVFLQGNNNLTPIGGDLMGEFEDALLKQRPNCESGSRLGELLDNRNKTHLQRRLSELEGQLFS